MQPLGPHEDVMQMIEQEGWAVDDGSHPAVGFCTDTAASWESIAGNSDYIGALRPFVSSDQPQDHILVYGPTRSGKTTTINLALMAKFCQRRTPALNPCHECSNCRVWASGPSYRNRSYRNTEGQNWTFLAVDGTDPSTYEEDFVCGYYNHASPLIYYVDEVVHPAFLRFMPRLLKPMTERPVSILASAIWIRPHRHPETKKILRPGLSKEFINRFVVCKTTNLVPNEARERLKCDANQLGLCPTDEALNLILEKTQGVYGQALRPLKEAKRLKRLLSLEFIQRFRWGN